MQETFERFFAQVQALAERHGITAYAVVAVTPVDTEVKGKIQVASHASSRYDGDDILNARCCDAMADSIEVALDRLTNGEDDSEPEYKN